jgi:hypothetical protein
LRAPVKYSNVYPAGIASERRQALAIQNGAKRAELYFVSTYGRTNAMSDV